MDRSAIEQEEIYRHGIRKKLEARDRGELASSVFASVAMFSFFYFSLKGVSILHNWARRSIYNAKAAHVSEEDKIKNQNLKFIECLKSVSEVKVSRGESATAELDDKVLSLGILRGFEKYI